MSAVEDIKPQVEAECAEGHHCHSFNDKLAKCSERVAESEGEGRPALKSSLTLWNVLTTAPLPRSLLL
ncbi:hypothetical protein BC829DRAFT_394120 [Chytridium lagenaria]|nr:hypothetical protein BC829DRAFT_394120 [Chytridium lagenaria]